MEQWLSPNICYVQCVHWNAYSSSSAKPLLLCMCTNLDKVGHQFRKNLKNICDFNIILGEWRKAYSFMDVFRLFGHVYDVMLRKHLGPVSFISACSAQCLTWWRKKEINNDDNTTSRAKDNQPSKLYTWLHLKTIWNIVLLFDLVWLGLSWCVCYGRAVGLLGCCV